MIKASAAIEIRQLITALSGDDDVQREAAIARLAIIGGRAVDRLVAAYDDATDRDTRIAVLRALELVGDRRTVPIARQALGQGGDLAVAAAAALRGLLDSPHAPSATDALDALVAVALDPAADRRARLAAFEALQEMPEAVRERVAAALEEDPDPGLKAGVAAAPREAAAAEAVWQDALEGRVPDHPALLRDAARTRAQAAALGSLRKMVDAVREREESAPEGAGGGSARPRHAEWRALRGALHQALALRGSRIAVYDLRETLAGAREPLPPSFLAALHIVGDESCLEALAAAYAHAPAADARWRHQLAEAFQAIAKREKVTRRTALMKRIAARWPDLPRALAAAGR